MNIKRSMKMKFNDEFVGEVHLWENGEVTVNFFESENGAECAAFLVKYAVQHMLQGSVLIGGEITINLN